LENSDRLAIVKYLIDDSKKFNKIYYSASGSKDFKEELKGL